MLSGANLLNLLTSLSLGVSKLHSGPLADGSPCCGWPSGRLQYQTPCVPEAFHFLTGIASAARRSVMLVMPRSLAACSTSIETWEPRVRYSRRNPSTSARGDFFGALESKSS